MKEKLFTGGRPFLLFKQLRGKTGLIATLSLCLILGASHFSYGMSDRPDGLAVAQQQKPATITGIIKDDSGEELIGVSVKIVGTTIGTITDFEGGYTLNNVPPGERTIEASYVGHDKKTIHVSIKEGEAAVVNIQLSSIGIELEEVTVTALGIKKADKALGYAISKVDSEELNNAISNNWLSGMSGKVAGLNFDQSSAGPGGTIRVTLRGEGSLSHDKNAALFVIDGVPVSSETTPSSSGSGYANVDTPIDYGGGIGDLNPEDIESVSILKGPSATALYGSRAANGAIVITTKSGKTASGLGITLNSSLTIEKAGFWPDFQNEYGAGNYSTNAIATQPEQIPPPQASWWTVGNVRRYWSRYNFGPKLDGTPTYMYDSRNWETNEYTLLPFVAQDWYKGFFETGNIFSNSVSIDSNNGKGSSFRFSIRDVRNKWIAPNTGYNSQNINASVRHKINPYMTVDVKATYNRKNSDNLPMSGYSSSSPLYSLIWVSSMASVKHFKDEYFSGRLKRLLQGGYGDSDDDNANKGQLTNYEGDNPYFQLYEHLNTMKRDRVFGNASVEVALIPDKLTLMGRTGMDWSGDFRTQRKPYYTKGNVRGSYREQNVNYFEMNNDFLLSYKDLFGDVDFHASFGGNNMVYQYRYITQTAPKLYMPDVFQLQNSDGPILTSNVRNQKSINSFFGFVSAGWRNTVYLEVTGRNDWSSTLPKQNNSYFYPSVNLSVLLGQALRLKEKAPWIDLMKVRASWANVGNDTDPYQLKQVYGNSSFVSAYKLSGDIQNNELKPENIESYEIGIDIRTFRNRYGLDVTYYDAETTNQIIKVPTGWETGASSQRINAGKVTNKGIEIAARIQPLKMKDWDWILNLNWNKNWNKLVELAPGVELWQLNASNTAGSRVFVYAYPGTELGRIYGVGYKRAPEGAFYTDGDGNKVDVSGQVIVNAETGNPVLGDELLDHGSVFPDWKAGLTQSLRYKNFNLRMTFSGQWGGRAYSVTHFALSYMGKLKNSLPGRYEGLVHEGVNQHADGTFSNNTKITTDVVDYYNTVVWNRNNVENNTHSTSFLKLKECRLDYRLPTKICNQIGFVKSLSLGVSATNLFCITDWPQYDPEVASFGGGSLNRGVEVGAFPMTRSYGFNLKVTL